MRMKSLKKDFFIVVSKDVEENNQHKYNVNFFYLKSLNKKAKQSFSYISTPFLKGKLIIGLDFKDKVRPLKFDKILKDGNLRPIDPKLFKNFLLSDRNKYIAFSAHASNEDKTEFMKMLKSFQFEKEKVINITLCESCLKDNKLRILDAGHQIKSIKGQIICPDCAEEIVLQRAKAWHLITSKKVEGRLKNFFRHLVLKFKDVKKVLESFKPNFNPIENHNLTLYDVEQTTPISKKYLNYHIKDLNIPDKFKKLLTELNIKTLLPIQAMSIEDGLLSQNQNQLIMAPTSGGKTLVGEIAGVSKLLEGKKGKMLYLVPIVALANIRELEFKKKYEAIGLNVVKKVGESLLENGMKNALEDIERADIIIGTYEAIDYILRSGKKSRLGNISTIIIDEIQTLIEQERGFLLDGLISRLKSINKNSQYLYLSATVGEPKILAKKLNSNLVRYTNRPVPVERHLILCQNKRIKLNHIKTLVRTAFLQRSSFGYKGQSIVFTNARKKCESITNKLRKNGIMVKAYHSGLTNAERKHIESQFQSQKIAGVVATAALAAGVDLPASQVIFESLAMGIQWLTVADFEQMLGRAGRLKKHEMGRAYLLVQPEKVYSPLTEKTEEEIAIKLLNGSIKDFELVPNADRSLTELLAFTSMFEEGCTRNEIYEFYQNLINNYYEINAFITQLIEKRLISQENDGLLKVTTLGRAIAKSFLTIERCFEIIDEIKNKKRDIKEIVLNLKPLKNVYLSKAVVSDLSKNLNMRYFSNNFFSSSVLSLMDAEYVKKKKRYSRKFIDLVLKWIKDIFNCSCEENPYCECGRINLEEMILNLRIEHHLSIEAIHNYLKEYYSIVVFKGDLIDYLENLIYSFESIRNIAEGIPNLDNSYKQELRSIPEIVERIKG
ncbi:MAG: DEAD/DEAH box helicase [Promethearchaeota archaeon]|nr:MAG: DEAD/DEAH box helicase [Candidatus Lokiarchaeota archaeon]